MAADADSLSVKHSHSHHSLLRDMPDHSNSHSDNTVKEGNNPERMKIERKTAGQHPPTPPPHTQLRLARHQPTDTTTNTRLSSKGAEIARNDVTEMLSQS